MIRWWSSHAHPMVAIYQWSAAQTPESFPAELRHRAAPWRHEWGPHGYPGSLPWDLTGSHGLWDGVHYLRISGVKKKNANQDDDIQVFNFCYVKLGTNFWKCPLIGLLTQGQGVFQGLLPHGFKWTTHPLATSKQWSLEGHPLTRLACRSFRLGNLTGTWTLAPHVMDIRMFCPSKMEISRRYTWILEYIQVKWFWYSISSLHGCNCEGSSPKERRDAVVFRYSTYQCCPKLEGRHPGHPQASPNHSQPVIQWYMLKDPPKK